jgi:hypothetical protein
MPEFSFNECFSTSPASSADFAGRRLLSSPDRRHVRYRNGDDLAASVITDG